MISIATLARYKFVPIPAVAVIPVSSYTADNIVLASSSAVI